MTSLVETFDQKLDLVRLELAESKKLSSNYEKALKNFTGDNWSGSPLYFNNSCLITENKSDAEILMKLPNCELMFALESSHFDFAFYFVTIIENKQLFSLIGGAND